MPRKPALKLDNVRCERCLHGLVQQVSKTYIVELRLPLLILRASGAICKTMTNSLRLIACGMLYSLASMVSPACKRPTAPRYR